MADADFTISEFLAWVRTKPAGETYCFGSNGHCAIAQFLFDTERALKPNVGETVWGDLADFTLPEHTLPAWANDAVKASDEYAAREHVFGALVKRLEALVPAPVTQSSWTHLDAYLVDIELALA